MNDTFSLLQKYTGISKYSKSEVITPQWVVSDMVDLYRVIALKRLSPIRREPLIMSPNE